MPVLILNRFPSNMAPYKEWLKDYKEDIYLFTNKRFSDQFEGFSKKEAYSKFQDNNLVDYDAMKLYQENPFDAIISLDETEIIRAARLRERLNIKGQKLKSAIAYRDKVVMKDYLTQAGITVPAYKRIRSSIDLYDFVREIGFPIIIKPTDGMASKSINFIYNNDDLEEFIKTGIPDNMEVESMVEGQMYHIDGIIQNGSCVFASVGKYINNTLQYKSGKGTAYTLLPPNNELFDRFVNFSKEVIEALPSISFSTFHCEVFHTKDDEIVFCEIASRTGGGRIDLAIKEMYKVDLNCLWARYECGLPIEIPAKLINHGVVGCTFIPMQKGKLIKSPSNIPFEWVVTYEQYAIEGETFRKPSSVVDAIGLVLVRGETVEEVESRISEIRVWLEKEIVWDVKV